MIKGIIFDMDGTLIDTNQLVIECIQESVAAFMGWQPSPDEFVEILGKPLSIQMGFFSDQKSDEMVAHYRKIYRERRDEKTFLFPGAIEMLEELHLEGVRMAIVSNKGRSGLRHALEKFNLQNYFDPVISVTDVQQQKPDPEGAFKTLEQWGFNPGEVLFIGDSANDILCANHAGIPSVLVGWSILPQNQFANLRIEFRVETMEGILDLVRSNR